MRFVLISDTHTECMSTPKLELADFVSRLKSDDVLLIAGDFMNPNHENWSYDLLEFISEKPKHTLYVSGNHEYYGSSINDVNNYFIQYEKKNDKFIYLDNETFEIDGIKIHGGTMWSNIGMGNDASKITNGISDFHQIKDFNSFDINHLNHLFNDYISNEVVDENSIILSHFLPSSTLIQKQFKGDSFNRYFCSGLYDTNPTLNPSYWVYGHDHSKDDTTTINKTKFISNQFGYYGIRNFGDVPFKSFELTSSIFKR